MLSMASVAATHKVYGALSDGHQVGLEYSLLFLELYSKVGGLLPFQ